MTVYHSLNTINERLQQICLVNHTVLSTGDGIENRMCVTETVVNVTLLHLNS